MLRRASISVFCYSTRKTTTLSMNTNNKKLWTPNNFYNFICKLNVNEKIKYEKLKFRLNISYVWIELKIIN